MKPRTHHTRTVDVNWPPLRRNNLRSPAPPQALARTHTHTHTDRRLPPAMRRGFAILSQLPLLLLDSLSIVGPYLPSPSSSDSQDHTQYNMSTSLKYVKPRSSGFETTLDRAVSKPLSMIRGEINRDRRPCPRPSPASSPSPPPSSLPSGCGWPPPAQSSRP